MRRNRLYRLRWGTLLALALLTGCGVAVSGIGSGSQNLPLKAHCTPHSLGGHRNRFTVKFRNSSDPAIVTLRGYQTRITNVNGETIDTWNRTFSHPRVIKPGGRREDHFYDRLLGKPTACEVIKETTG